MSVVDLKGSPAWRHCTVEVTVERWKVSFGALPEEMSKRTRMPWDPSHMAPQGLELQGLSSDKQLKDQGPKQLPVCLFHLYITFTTWQVKSTASPFT